MLLTKRRLKNYTKSNSKLTTLLATVMCTLARGLTIHYVLIVYEHMGRQGRDLRSLELGQARRYFKVVGVCNFVSSYNFLKEK